MEPIKDVPPPSPTGRYNWAQYTDGEWYKFRDAPEGLPVHVNAKANNNIKTAAYDWARRHGYRAETRVTNHSRTVHIRFRKEES
jgi:hypothetical protein